MHSKTPTLPSKSRAWQWSSSKGGLEKNITLDTIPIVMPLQNQHLVRVLAAGLNPTDYKTAESTLLHFAWPKISTPVLDFCGRIVIPSPKTTLRPGQLVYGCVSAKAWEGRGALCEYAVVDKETTGAAPDDSMDSLQLATATIAGLTAYQSIIPHIKAGQRIFINGGSGGTGVFAIQIAKIARIHVTVTCSTVNTELCRSLGADEVVDYTAAPLLDQLKTRSQFDHVVDNVGNWDLYYKSHHFLREGGSYIMVGGDLSVKDIFASLKAKLIPAALGGGRRRVIRFYPEPKVADVEQVVAWMYEGRLRSVIDECFTFEEAPKALKRLKEGRTKGKLAIRVTNDAYD